MTSEQIGRVCPVHGEWSATGVCRWCEKLSGADQSTITLPLGCICQKCLRGFDAPIPLTSLVCPECRAKAPTYMGVPVVLDAGASRFADAPPILVSWPKESAVEKASREYFATRDGMRPLFSTRQRYSTPEGIASHNAFWEAKLAAQHAALRWERVARRWATKAKFDGHERTVDGTLAFDDRCSECRRTMRLTDVGIPKEWP